MVDVLVAPNIASCARDLGRFTNAGHGTERSGGLSIQTAGIPGVSVLTIVKVGFSKVCEIVLGWSLASSSPCWVPCGSDEAPERLEQVVGKEIFEEIRDLALELSSERKICIRKVLSQGVGAKKLFFCNLSQVTFQYKGRRRAVNVRAKAPAYRVACQGGGRVKQPQALLTQTGLDTQKTKNNKQCGRDTQKDRKT